jgi:hypothetical protein
MKDYCMKQYEHFVKGLMTLYDEQEGRYISWFLNGSKFDKARKNTVQVLFPIMVPDIPQAHKDGIISMLSSVIYLSCRKNIIAQIIRFQQSLALIHPIILFLALIWCGEDHPGLLRITSSWKASETVTIQISTKRSVLNGWTRH